MLITVKGQTINVETAGSGQSVVLLHGWGQNMEMMRPIFDHMKEWFQVIMMDLPGFGESEEPDTAWSIQDYADFLSEVLDVYEAENPILIAHSFGARIAFRYALNHSVHKMILTGAAGIRPHHSMEYYGKVYWYKIKKHLGLIKGNEGSRDFQDASSIMRQILVKCVNEDITPMLSSIHTETLLVWGTLDEQTPLWMGKKLAKRMPNAALAIFDGDDHFAYFHQMNRFLRVLDCFLVRERTDYE
ncbi:MAG: alpha/beta hydrolase [Erysipelotrichaceae bacterium]|nr:alpha/beta hydrolase [Erysipelotrichaceae bacterium]